MGSRKNYNVKNDFAMKFKTPASRRKLCKDYIKHIESGLSDECFPECDPQTLKKYVELYPKDFDTDLMIKSRRMRRLFWEEMGLRGSNGKIKGFNAKSWEFNMKNRFKEWRDKHEIEHSGEMTFKTLPQLIKEMNEEDKKKKKE